MWAASWHRVAPTLGGRHEGHGADRLQNVRAQAGKTEGRWPGARQAVRARQRLGLVQVWHEAAGSAFLLLTPTSPIWHKTDLVCPLRVQLECQERDWLYQEPAGTASHI